MNNTVVILGLTGEAIGRIVNSIAYNITEKSELVLTSSINPSTQSDIMSYAVIYLF